MRFSEWEVKRRSGSMDGACARLLSWCRCLCACAVRSQRACAGKCQMRIEFSLQVAAFKTRLTPFREAGGYSHFTFAFYLLSLFVRSTITIQRCTLCIFVLLLVLLLPKIYFYLQARSPFDPTLPSLPYPFRRRHALQIKLRALEECGITRFFLLLIKLP